MVVQGWGQSPWKHEKKANFRRVVEGFSAGGKSPAIWGEKVWGVHIRCCGNGRLWFRPYGESLLANAPKGTKRSRPSVRPLAKARGSFAPVFIRGHSPQVGFATTYMQRVRLRRTALRATPRMNTSTQPPEGAGGSRSRAAGELTLGLMSGGERRRTTIQCRSWLASEDGLPADQSLADVPQTPVGAGKPAPTGVWRMALVFHHSSGRALARLQLLILRHRRLERPSGGSAQWATRHGCRVSRPRPWMADGGGPTEQGRSEGMPSLGEAPNERGKSVWLLCAFQSDPL
ncbi:hypothetical protein PS833_05131 [Pseudomonas fluorescens]|uniref:Uncharacterized protein n=1 Tax=Pseudomonas fluorescens TaxID=294 RepID=A0A5E7F0X6_PSEFL|nr:hypothetical protein PS833_05131 [Pseudomonas fluorescens]